LFRRNLFNWRRRHLSVIILGIYITLGFVASRPELSPMHQWNRAFGDSSIILIAITMAVGPLSRLSAAFKALLPWRRELGIYSIIFAGIHTAHLGLILMRVNHVEGFETADVVNLYGSFVYAIILVMLITSFDGPARAIGRKGWKGLHKTGLFVLFGGFLSSQLPKSLDQLDFANGVLVALAAVALVIRITAFLVRYRAKGQPQ